VPRKAKRTQAPLLPFQEFASQIDSLMPTNIIRRETVFSRRPVHVLSKSGTPTICIEEYDEKGKLRLRWKVDFTSNVPRQLAYKIDTLIVSRRIDEYRRRNLPVPELLRLGTLSEIAEEMNIRVTGPNLEGIRQGLLANAQASIQAYLRYVGRDKAERAVKTQAGFNRYSVIFHGSPLDEEGTVADATYILFNKIYLNVINNATDRPLDYDYLKQMSPGPLRFYELLSFKMHWALRNKEHAAQMVYSEYCANAPQRRYYTLKEVQDQMKKLHKPHLQHGYISDVNYERIHAPDGTADFLISYRPGPKALADFKSFNRETLTLAPAPEDDAICLVAHFHLLARNVKAATPSEREIGQARELISRYGAEKARRIVEYAITEMRRTRFTNVRWFGAVLNYATQAIAALQDSEPEQQGAEGAGGGHTSNGKKRPPTHGGHFDELEKEAALRERAEGVLKDMPPKERQDLHKLVEDQTITRCPQAKNWDKQTLEETIRRGMLRVIEARLLSGSGH